ncbi:MAG: tol-pal system protein YbgF [Alphaproteobacteria bacterium]
MTSRYRIAALAASLLAAAAAAPSAVAQAPAIYAQQELRIGQLEEQIRQLTGRIEELGHQVRQLQEQAERAQRDIDFRLSEIERGRTGSQAGAPAGGPPPSAAAPPPAAPPPRAPQAGAPTPLANAPPPGGPPPPGQSRVIAPAGPEGSAPPRPAAPPAPAAPPPSAARTPDGQLPAGPPQQQYDHAFSLLARGDYPAAEQSMRAFVRQHPNDRLASNAQYWLGETFYVRQDYQNAAISFAEGYKRYPQGVKAPDTLLKLGMSLAQLKQRDDACGAFRRLEQMNEAPGNLRDGARRERQRLGC